MPEAVSKSTSAAELAWLLDVTESRQPLSEHSPIWVRNDLLKAGSPAFRPQWHPHCECGILLEGGGKVFVEGAEAKYSPGQMILLGPGIPHWARTLKYPTRSITVYFLPSVLIEMGPESDGIHILQRFTAKQSLPDRLIRIPKGLRDPIIAAFLEMSQEFNHERFGREVALRSLLLTTLMRLIRWEESKGIRIGGQERQLNWQPIAKALRFLRENYTQPVYAQGVARFAGVSETRLKELFRKALGITWVKYLQVYRIHRAAALLSQGDHSVTEAALMVGFDSLSHFNETFHSLMGASPKNYQRKLQNPIEAEAAANDS